MVDDRSGPRDSRSRLWGVDAARGVALIGMMAIHVLPGEDRSLAYTVAHGRSAAAFALLAGVGLALATSRVRAGPEEAWAGVGAGVAARGLAIGAIGLSLGYPDSGVAVILPYYAVFFLLAVPLLRLGSGALAALALVAAIAVPVGSHLARPYLPPARVTNPTFDTLAESPARLLVELLLTGYYPVLAWMAYLCAGLAVGQLALRSARVAAGLLGGGVALAAAAWIGSWTLLNVLGGRERLAATLGVTDPGGLDSLLSQSKYGTTPPSTWWWLSVLSPHSSTPFDLAHTTGTALALLGAALLVERLLAAPSGRRGVPAETRVAARPSARPALFSPSSLFPLFPLVSLFPLAAAGGMTLTLYTAHVTLLGSSLPPADPATSYAVQVLAALALATAWRGLLRRGPIEEVVAALSAATRRGVARARAGPVDFRL